METTDELSGGSVDVNETFLTLVGGVSAVSLIVMLTVVGALAVESVVYGAIAGVFAGVGSFMFLPWFMHLSALQDASEEDVPFSELVDDVPRSMQLGVFGLGLELGGIVMIGIGMAQTSVNYAIGIGAALLVAVTVFLVASVLLD